VARRRESGHVASDLADDDFGRPTLNAGDRAQQPHCGGERSDLFADRLGEPVDLLIEEVDVREDRADPQCVVLFEASLERLSQGWDLLAQLPPREVREHLRVSLAGDQRVEHVTGGSAPDVRGDAVELDPGVLQRLVQPVDLTSALLDLRLAIPGQVPQLPDRLGSHEVRSQQPGLDQPAQPLGVTDIGLAAGDLLDVPRVDQQAPERVLQDRPRQLPIHAAGLHRHLLDAKRVKPIPQRKKPAHRRRELLNVLLAAPTLSGNPHARRDRRLVNIQRR